eukprot:4357329-Pleurochrysis_carterae.AAC.2
MIVVPRTATGSCACVHACMRARTHIHGDSHVDVRRQVRRHAHGLAKPFERIRRRRPSSAAMRLRSAFRSARASSPVGYAVAKKMPSSARRTLNCSGGHGGWPAGGAVVVGMAKQRHACAWDGSHVHALMAAQGALLCRAYDCARSADGGASHAPSLRVQRGA